MSGPKPASGARYASSNRAWEPIYFHSFILQFLRYVLSLCIIMARSGGCKHPEVFTVRQVKSKKPPVIYVLLKSQTGKGQS